MINKTKNKLAILKKLLVFLFIFGINKGPVYGQNNSGNSFKEKGFLNIEEIGIYSGIGDVNVSSVSAPNNTLIVGIRSINGIQFNSFFSAGVGIGIDRFYSDISVGGTNYLPLFLDFRYTPLKGKVSPSFNANIGYDIGLAKESGERMFVVNPTLGVRIYMSPKKALLFNIGYKLIRDNVTIIYTHSPGPLYAPYNSIGPTGSAFIHFLSMNMGFTF
jgi:hypothetical protein